MNAAPLAMLAQAEPAPVLDPPTRAVLLMSLLAFVILGLGLMAGVMIGGRWVRRLGGEQLSKPLPLRRPADDEPPRRPREPAMLRGVDRPSATDTARIEPAETRVG